jgi:hypothetical protein
MKINKSSLCLLFCFLSFLITISSQNSVIDSLQNELKFHNEEDTIRVNLLTKMIYEVYDVDVCLQTKVNFLG